jgi:integrase
MSKRGQNEGSIYKRPDGRWTSAIGLGYHRGKLKRQYFYGKTREEVSNKLIQALEKRRQGLPVAFDRQTVGQFLDQWLKETVKPSVRQNTYCSYEQNIRLYLKPCLGTIDLSKLTPQHIQSFMNSQRKEARSARLVNYQRTILRCALNDALKWNLVARNVAALVDPLHYRKAEIEPLTVADAESLLKVIKGDRLETVFHVALTLGLREGEILGLRWQDVDFDNQLLRVAKSLQRIDKKLQLVEPKTKKSKRTLPIPENLLSSLRAHRTRQLEEKLFAGTDWQENGLVFATSIGTPLYARNVIRSFHRLLNKAKLRRYRFHDLRHSCATFLLAKNVPARVVMDILGHSNISLTMNTYSHVIPEMLKAAAEAMNTFIAEPNVANS